ncbi:MAG TPA: PDZ domain-containing protein, partial [Albitalea sp.]|nr:PDZ domain-containing protein [Albitalea sp.]
NCVEVDGAVRIVRITPESPAESAGLKPGDQIVRIDQVSVGSLEGFYKALWQGDDAERTVSLQIKRDNAEKVLQVKTQDRMKTLRRAQGI